ncbi:MAG: hypothetical protein ACYC6L_14815, partial [Anaerolineae bacterium]
ALTESLAQGNGTFIPQMIFATYHNRVGVIEPGQPFLAVPLYWLALQFPKASNIAAVMLFNVLVTALTGGVLYLLVRYLSFSKSIAIFTTLAWGLCSMAWPYSRNYFREPMIGLIWISATLSAIAFSRTNRYAYAFVCTTLLCIGLTVKTSSAATVPIFFLSYLWDARTHRITLNWRRILLLLGSSAMAVAVSLQLYTYITSRTTLSLPKYTIEYSFRDALLRAYGAFLSPIKGLVWYSPVLAATIIGWYSFIKKQGMAALLILGVVLSLVFIYGDVYYWHGGSVVWGPRYHLPLLPLLMLPVASALALRSIFAKIWVGTWSLAGLGVQLTVATNSWSDAVWQALPAFQDETLVGMNGIPWTSWRLYTHSPALVQVLSWRPGKLDILWLRQLVEGGLAWDRFLSFELALIAAMVVALLVYNVLRLNRKLEVVKWHAAASIGLVILGSCILVSRSGLDSNDSAGLTRLTARNLAKVINTTNDKPYTLTYVSNDFFTNYWLGLAKGEFIPQWYSPIEVGHFSEVTENMREAETIWLVIDRVHMAPEQDPYVARKKLAQQAYEINAQWVDGYEVFRYLAPTTMMLQEAKGAWAAGIKLASLAIDRNAVQAGDAMRLDLAFSTTEQLAMNYTLYVHIVAPDGQVIPSRDGEPQAGEAPTKSWKPGQVVLERRGFLVPADTPPGTYKIVCGWYTQDGTVLAPKAGEGEVIDKAVVIGTVVVLPKPAGG